MDHGLDLGVPHHLELQLQERPERQQNQDEDCYHSEGDDNFKVSKASTQDRFCCKLVYACAPGAQGGAQANSTTAAAWQADQARPWLQHGAG
jgi:hypothetical protein